MIKKDTSSNQSHAPANSQEVRKKKAFQDVVPASRSIRNIEVPSRRKTIAPLQEVAHTISETPFLEQTPSQVSENIFIPTARESSSVVAEKNTHQYAYTYDEPPQTSKTWLYVSIGIFLIAFAFGVSALFKNAKITITPHNETRTLSSVGFIAQKDAGATDSAGGNGTGLGFQVVTVSKSVEQKVNAGGEQNVSIKAHGTIVIYNNSGTATQRLIANTRFQTPAGLVFRLILPSTIPGRHTVNGKIIPGSVEAEIVADVPGPLYNIDLSDFTLPALKGDSKFFTIYGRSKTTLTGGASGLQKVISPDTLHSTDVSLENQLKQSLAQEISSQIPANFILYISDISYSFSLPETLSSESSSGLMVQKKGTATAIIFDKTALSRAISAKVLPGIQADTLKVSNLDSLSFAYSYFSTSSPSHALQENTISFSLSGPAHFVSVLDLTKLKSSLLGLSKVQAHTVLAVYPSIQEAWIETHPFWNDKIPLDPNKVTVTNIFEP